MFLEENIEISLGYVWFSENIKERKKKNYFLIFDSPMKNFKKNKIWLKLVKNLYIFKLFNLYIDVLQ